MIPMMLLAACDPGVAGDDTIPDGLEPCEAECPAGSRPVAIQETLHTSFAAGGRFAYADAYQCESGCEPLQPCPLPNAPSIFVGDDGTAEYVCAPLPGWTGALPDPATVDLSFGEAWNDAHGGGP